MNSILKAMHSIFRKDPITMEITESVSNELMFLEDAEKDVVKQTIIDDATWGLDLQEKEFGITTDPNKSYEERRSVIKARRRGKGKLTLELIKRTVEAYTYAQTEVKFDGVIHIAFTSVYGRPPNMENVYATIENIKPAHIPVEYTFRYRTHDDIRNCMATHQKLSEITHEEIRSGQVDFLPINGGR